MKESLAILFVGLLTGMVFAQTAENQFRSNTNSGPGAMGSSSSNLNGSGSVRTTSDGIQITSRGSGVDTAARRGQSKVHVPVNHAKRNELIRTGEIVWKIQGNDSVQQVSIGQSSEPQFGQKPVEISSSGRSLDGKSLFFDLNDDQVRNLDHSYFHYDVPAQYRDKVENIVIRTKENPQAGIATNPNPTPATQPRNNFAGQTNPGLGQRPARKWNLPGLDTTGRPNIEPTVQTGQDFLAQQRQRKIWEDEQRLAQQKYDLDLQAMRIQQQTDLLNAQNRAAQTQPSQPFYAAPNRYATNSPITQAPLPTQQPMVIPQQASYVWQPPVNNVETERLKRLNAEVKLENETLKNRMAYIENRIASNEELASRFGNSTEPPTPEYFSKPKGIDGRRPTLNASSPDASVRNKIFDQDPNAGRDKSVNSENPGVSPGYLMTLLLLAISGALNFYLWFIARSFHSRYNELADELRETFASTA